LAQPKKKTPLRESALISISLLFHPNKSVSIVSERIPSGQLPPSLISTAALANCPQQLWGRVRTSRGTSGTCTHGSDTAPGTSRDGWTWMPGTTTRSLSLREQQGPASSHKLLPCRVPQNPWANINPVVRCHSGSRQQKPPGIGT
jgi:hypothetical protein